MWYVIFLWVGLALFSAMVILCSGVNALPCMTAQLLSMQNGNGGYASYERKRGSILLELLNPAEVFGTTITCFLLYEYAYIGSPDSMN